MKKRFLTTMATVMVSALMLTACGGSEKEADTNQGVATEESTFEGMINPVSREDGSGTRGAFIELFGIETKDENGNKIDNTTEMAEITNSTSVMLTTIQGNEYAIGYVSLGSLNDNVKALSIDGAEATIDTIKSGSYKIARPFNIVTKEEISEVAADFIKYIMSEQGQAVVEENGYISNGNEGTYETSGLSGKVTVAGSSSVTPVMEKLKESYTELNPDVEIEVQQNDSTTGVNSAIEGICDIGMASRELKDSEKEEGVKGTAIALDGIAVIVNIENPISDMEAETVRQIFTGEVMDWSEVK